MGRVGASLRGRLANPASQRSWAARARAQRRQWLLDTFPDLESLRVIDLGGTVQYWLPAEVQPRELVVVNNDAAQGSAEPAPAWMSVVRADACCLPESLLTERFDLAYSNSLIEHLGGHARRLEFAHAVRTIADHYWVQTPNRRFAVEPHFLFPGFVALPLNLKVAIARKWTPAWTWRPGMTRDDAVAEILNIELLTPRLMRFYFPDARLLKERVGPLVKSLIAVR
jgi:hypothetical protein